VKVTNQQSMIMQVIVKIIPVLVHGESESDSGEARDSSDSDDNGAVLSKVIIA